MQLALFDMGPDPEAVRRRVLLEDSELILDFDELRAGIDHHGELALSLIHI